MAWGKLFKYLKLDGMSLAVIFMSPNVLYKKKENLICKYDFFTTHNYCDIQFIKMTLLYLNLIPDFQITLS